MFSHRRSLNYCNAAIVKSGGGWRTLATVGRSGISLLRDFEVSVSVRGCALHPLDASLTTSIDTNRTALFRIIRGPVWNSLPSALLDNSCSLNAYYAFWRRLKTYLFRQFKHHPAPLCRFRQWFWHPILYPTQKYSLLRNFFLHRCMECRRGLAMRILSFCPSVCQTHELWQNGIKSVQILLRKKAGWWADPFYLKKLGQPAPVGVKSPILNRYSLVAPLSVHFCTFSFVYQKWE